MIAKEFENITQLDIESLIANGVREERTLEYKEKLPCNSDESKKEFLADISSFANAAGGDLIFGLKESRDESGKPTGIPATIRGLGLLNVDSEKLRLESIIRDGLAPRVVPPIQIRGIQGTSGLVVLIRIRKSWSAPHMVTYKGLSRFYSRTSAGKYQLAVDEIRSAFIASESIREKIERFRLERLAKIVGDETPILLLPGPKIILHMIPLSSAAPGAKVDLTGLIQGSVNLHCLNTGSNGRLITFDGFLLKGQQPGSQGSLSYTLVFRNGVIEATDVGLLKPHVVKKQFPSI